jgi:hypothetical protein
MADVQFTEPSAQFTITMTQAEIRSLFDGNDVTLRIDNAMDRRDLIRRITIILRARTIPPGPVGGGA